MKKFLFILSIMYFFFESICYPDIEPTPAVLREWVRYAGVTDSTFKTPVISSGYFTIVAALVLDNLSGPYIRIIQYDKEGQTIRTYNCTGNGNGRDQAANIIVGTDSIIYVCEATYASSINYYDFIIISLTYDGVLRCIRTFNSTASQYDVATSVVANDTFVYITGVTYSSGTFLDYQSIRYERNGNVVLQNDFDNNSLMDIPVQISYSEKDTSMIVKGGIQSILQDWDYQTVKYTKDGVQIYQNRVSGSAAGFDRAQAVTTDDSSYIYIPGGTLNTDFDIKTAKFDAKLSETDGSVECKLC